MSAKSNPLMFCRLNSTVDGLSPKGLNSFIGERVMITVRYKSGDRLTVGGVLTWFAFQYTHPVATPMTVEFMLDGRHVILDREDHVEIWWAES